MEETPTLFQLLKRNKTTVFKILFWIPPVFLLWPMYKSKARILHSKYFPFYFRGIIIPFYGMVIRKECASDVALHLHESIHWRQFQRMGLFMFLFRYFYQLIFIGYDSMPMEMEARQNLPPLIQWNYRDIFFSKKAIARMSTTVTEPKPTKER